MNMKTFTAITLSAALTALTAGCSSSSDGGGDGGGTTLPPASGGDSGSSAIIFDRMGRPGVSTALVAAADRKDAYNLAGDPAAWSGFLPDLVERITIIDGLDGTVGNALLDADTLAGLLADDRLQIDTSIAECDVYLALEIGLGGCGGRTLQRDVIDDTLRHLVSQGMPVSDLADGAVDIGLLSDEWPFLAPPNP